MTDAFTIRDPFERRIINQRLPIWRIPISLGRTSDVSLGGIGASIVGGFAVNDVVSVEIPLCGGSNSMCVL